MTPLSVAGRRAALLLALLLAAALAYAPGLDGTWLIDDGPTLSGLGMMHDEPTLYTALKFVLTSRASELGRPLAMLTFVAQWPSWDARPADFLLVNLLLHLCNGVLWLACVRRLQRLAALPSASLLPLLACAVWLLLPMHVATVLYVTQRMTVLATTFVLAGVLLYLAGREVARGGATAGGYRRMTAGILLAVVAGTLSKETAALTPLLLLVLEGTVLQPAPRPPHWRAWSAAFLWLPLVLLVAYLGVRMPVLVGGYGSRDFGLAERLFTEARLLFAYLGEAFLPRAHARLFYDDFAISRSLLAPVTTLPAAAGWLALGGVAVVKRRAWPLYSLAVGWYLAGHLLESSFVPLEIGFAHRNYLPLLGVSLALAAGACRLLEQPALGRIRGVIAAAGAAYVAALAACLALATGLWSQPAAQARQWALHQPESHRAAHEFGRRLVETQQLDAALGVFRGAWERWPDDAMLPLALYEIGCVVPGAGPSTADVLAVLQGTVRREIADLASAVRGVANRSTAGTCPLHGTGEVLSLVDALLQLPRFAGAHFLLQYSASQLLDAAGDADGALERLERAIELDPQVPLLQQAIVWRLSRGDVAAARAHLQTLEFSGRIRPLTRWAFRLEIRGTRQLLDLYESPDKSPA